MPSIATKKTPEGTPRGCFIACFREYDAGKGKVIERQRTTGVPVGEGAAGKRKAMKIARAYEAAAAEVVKAVRGELKSGPALYKRQLEAIWAAAGVSTPGSTITWRVASSRYIKERCRASITNSTEDAYRASCDSFSKWLGGRVDSPLADLTFEDFDAFHTDYLKTHAPQTAKSQMRYISAVISRCIELDEMEKNFASRVTTSSRSVTEKRAFSAIEVKMIFNYLKREKLAEWAFACLAAYHNGFRIADATTLKVSDFVSHSDGRIVVMLSPSKKSKGGSRKPLPFPCVGEFKELYLELAKRAGEDGRLTPSIPNSATSSRAFGQILARAGIEVKKTGLPQGRQVANLSFHSWRRTSKTNMDNAGVSHRVADRINDHEDEGVAASYSEISIEAMEAAIEQSTKRVWAC